MTLLKIDQSEGEAIVSEVDFHTVVNVVRRFGIICLPTLNVINCFISADKRCSRSSFLIIFLNDSTSDREEGGRILINQHECFYDHRPLNKIERIDFKIFVKV